MSYSGLRLLVYNSLGGFESSSSGDPSMTDSFLRKSASLTVGVLGISASDWCSSAGEVLDIMAPRAGISSGV